MKDKLISKNLEYYADALEKKEEILFGAYAEMDAVSKQRQASFKRKYSIKRRSVFALATAFMIFIGIFAMVRIFSLDGADSQPNQSLSYSLSDLNKRAVSQEELSIRADVMLFNETIESYELKEAYIYVDVDTGETLVTYVKYRAIRNGFVDEIVIISDLKGGLREYGQKSQTDGAVVALSDSYENGEYYSQIYSVQENTAYYVFIASPTTDAVEAYINIF